MNYRTLLKAAITPRASLKKLVGEKKKADTLEKNVKNLEKNVKRLEKDIARLRGTNHKIFDEEFAYRAFAGKRLINIGAGRFYHKNWTNLDVPSEHYDSKRTADYIPYNIISDERIPFDDSSVAIAYTSHTIEHVKDEYVQLMFKEVHRVLEPGGIFRVTCPDADLFYTAMLLNNFDRFFYRRHFWFTRHGIPANEIDKLDFLKMAFATNLTHEPLVRTANEALWDEIRQKAERLPKEEFLNWLCKQVDFSIEHISCHINWWTIEKVSSFLLTAGFSMVRPSTYGGSLAAPMCDINLFDSTVYDESLYIEACKL